MSTEFWALASRLTHHAAKFGGWTHRIDMDISPDYGWSVGGDPAVPEHVIPGWRNLPGPVLLQFVGDHLQVVRNAGRGITGGWAREDGALVLDSPTIILTSEADAIALGRERGEDAIYCLHTGETTIL